MNSVNNEQLVAESKIIKANNENDLIDRVNDYIHNRPARLGELKEIGKIFCMQVDILCQPTTQVIKWEYVQPHVATTPWIVEPRKTTRPFWEPEITWTCSSIGSAGTSVNNTSTFNYDNKEQN